MFWLKVRCVQSGLYYVTSDDKMWEISRVNKKEWARRPLTARTVEELNELLLKKKSKGVQVEYGIVEGDYMYRHIIVRVGNTREEVEDVSNKRFPKPKRLSTSDTKIAMKLFYTREEVLQGKDNKKKIKKLPDKTTGNELVNRFNKNLEKKEKENESGGENDKSNIMGEPTASELGGNPNSIKDKAVEGVQDTSLPEVDKDIIEPEASNLDGGKDDDEVAKLKKEVAELKKQLANQQPNELLQKIVQQTAKISAQISPSPGKCNLNTLKYAVPLSAEDKDLVVPDGFTYVGGDIKIISHTDLAEIDESEESFNLKGEMLFKAITGESIGKFSKTMKGVKRNRKLGLKVISEVTIAAFKKIIDTFQWVDKPTPKEIYKFFQKQPYEVRRKTMKKQIKTQNKKNKSSKKKGSEEESSDSDDEEEKRSKSKKRKESEEESDSSSDEDKGKKSKKKKRDSDQSNQSSSEEPSGSDSDEESKRKEKKQKNSDKASCGAESDEDDGKQKDNE